MRGLGIQAVLNASATVLSGAYAVVAIGIILQTLGPRAYAPWATAAVLLGWLNLLDLGLAQTVVRASARALLGDRLGVRDVHSAIGVYAGLGAGGMAIGVGMAFVLPSLLHLPATESSAAVRVGILLALDAAIVLSTAAWPGILRGTGGFAQLLSASAVQVATSLPLLITLLPVLGLQGAALAQLGGRVAGRCTMAFLIHRHTPWIRLMPQRPAKTDMYRVAGFSAPIFLMQLASQIGSGTDILIVAAVSGATGAGLYAAGTQLVRYLAYFLFPVVDVVFPRLSALEYSDPGLVKPVLVRTLWLVGAMSAAVFGAIAMEARLALEVWSGQAAQLSVIVLGLYAIAYLLITPAHILVIALIARAQHRLVAVVILAEALANLVLSIVLALALGPIGPALSTLVVVALDDLLVLPMLAGRQLGLTVFRVGANALTGMAIGLAIVAVTQPLGGDDVGGLIVRGILRATILAAVLWVGIRRPLSHSSDSPSAGVG